jgi:hypothetical protein
VQKKGLIKKKKVSYKIFEEKTIQRTRDFPFIQRENSNMIRKETELNEWNINNNKGNGIQQTTTVMEYK